MRLWPPIHRQEASSGRTRNVLLVALSMLAGSVFLPPPAAAQDGRDECRYITKVPIQIKSSGCWHLAADLKLLDPTATAITIKADDVNLDLRGYHIAATPAKQATSVGVYANGRSRIKITNGRFSNFFYGVRIDRGTAESSAADIAVSDISVSDSTFRGIMINAAKSSITNSVVDRVGGTEVFPDSFAMGIEIFGNDCLVRGNKVTDVFPVGIGEGVGISLSSDIAGCRVIENEVVNSQIDPHIRVFGAWLGVTNSTPVTVTDNTFKRVTYAYWVSRVDSRPWPGNVMHVMHHNTGIEIECSPSDFPGFYHGLDTSNIFTADVDGCSDSIVARTAQLAARGNDDPRALFALAMAYYQSHEEFSQSYELKASQRRYDNLSKAIELLQSAEALGHQESKRVMPRVAAAFRDEANKLRLPARWRHADRIREASGTRP